MRIPLFILLLSLASYSFQIHGAIVLVHGSFGKHGTWYKPGGAFYTNLAAQTHHQIYSFSWSGSPLPLGIIEASTELVKHILSLPPDEEVIIEAHSNGGNVVFYASMLLYQAQQLSRGGTINQCLQPLLSSFREYPPKRNATKQEIFRHTQIDTALRSSLLEIMEQLTPRRSPENYFITHAHVMGTPINTELFRPHPEIIQYVYNWYSKNDNIQTLVGQRTLPPHDRQINLEVSFKKNGILVQPGHNEINNEIMGRWILHVANLLLDDQLDRNTRFNDGAVILSEQEAPIYIPHQKKDLLTLLPEVTDSSQKHLTPEDKQ